MSADEAGARDVRREGVDWSTGKEGDVYWEIFYIAWYCREE